MLNAQVSLALIIAFHELDRILVDARPVVFLLQDLVCQAPALQVVATNTFIDLM